MSTQCDYVEKIREQNLNKNPLNEALVCDMIKKVNLFILNSLANIVGDYLQPYFNETRYDNNKFAHSGLNYYAYCNSNFSTKFNIVNNTLKPFIHGDFSITFYKPFALSHCDEYMDICIDLFNKLPPRIHHKIIFIMPKANLNVIKTIDSFDDFSKQIKISYSINNGIGLIPRHNLLENNPQLHLALWQFWRIELQPAIRAFW